MYSSNFEHESARPFDIELFDRVTAHIGFTNPQRGQISLENIAKRSTEREREKKKPGQGCKYAWSIRGLMTQLRKESFKDDNFAQFWGVHSFELRCEIHTRQAICLRFYSFFFLRSFFIPFFRHPTKEGKKDNCILWIRDKPKIPGE